MFFAKLKFCLNIGNSNINNSLMIFEKSFCNEAKSLQKRKSALKKLNVLKI